ncbi:WAT1-related protein At5g64700-like isoform X2 [Vigna radiata var. radiata]|uniref:WAT1-related protein n=1 Tax=Vigna radiata var. radiata TaxID=3916 RepID=A0A3Q0F1N6_VIGRR|nr:WAT1-related protein At5g64700-like isoform X2 [Vigna radiata var. radiata]
MHGICHHKLSIIYHICTSSFFHAKRQRQRVLLCLISFSLHTMEGKNMKTVKEWLSSSQVVLSMFVVQVVMTGMQLLSRVILVQGTFIGALIVYRHLVAALCVAPFALYLERGKPKKFNCEVWCWLFVNALTGMTMAQGLFYYGLRDTSAAYSMSLLNLVPIITFFTSIILRMEKLKWETWVGKAKSVGSILCVGGASLSSVYKGKEFFLGHHIHPTHQTAPHKTHILHGTIFLVCSCFSYTAWFIAQYWGTMLACILAAIQAAAVGVCLDSSKAAWRLEWNLQLITIVYSGALATAATFCIISWAIRMKGPTYPPMFNPLSLIFVAFSEALILGQPLGVGTLGGMVLIIMGLYFFLWGKSNETHNAEGTTTATQSTSTVVPSASPTHSVLLQIQKTQNTSSC